MTVNSSVESFILLKDRFVPLSQCDSKIPDDNYIEGKIELQIGDSRILSEEQWDLIDQLWAYLVDGVSGIVFDDRNLECFFPDQPLRLSLRAAAQQHIEVTIGSDIHLVDKACFVEAIAVGGKSFFNCMLRIVPTGNATWTNYVEKCEKLIAAN